MILSASRPPPAPHHGSESRFLQLPRSRGSRSPRRRPGARSRARPWRPARARSGRAACGATRRTTKSSSSTPSRRSSWARVPLGPASTSLLLIDGTYRCISRIEQRLDHVARHLRRRRSADSAERAARSRGTKPSASGVARAERQPSVAVPGERQHGVGAERASSPLMLPREVHAEEGELRVGHRVDQVIDEVALLRRGVS